jgi:hypothetical protein
MYEIIYRIPGIKPDRIPDIKPNRMTGRIMNRVPGIISYRGADRMTDRTVYRVK